MVKIEARGVLGRRQASANVAAEQGFMEREKILLNERERAQRFIAVREKPELGRIVL